jgi:glycosyltransferase involved in cell wall biosynthesis
VVVGVSLLSHTRDQFTGTGRYVRELARGLGNRTDRVRAELLCNEQTIAEVRTWATAGVRVSQAADFRIGPSRLGRAAAVSVGLTRRRRASGAFHLDVDLVHYPLTLTVPPASVPTVVTLHDVRHRDHPEHFSRVERAWRRVSYDRASRRATLVVTDSEHARGRIVESLGIPPERVVAIHLAVDRERFRPARPGDPMPPAALGLPERFVVYPASLWTHKNHARLLAALARVEDRDIALVLTGATFGRLDALMGEARRLGVAERVRHLGLVGDDVLPAVYRAASGLVFPSLYECFGAPPLEAMASGVPVASSRAASLAEVCGGAALVLDPYDVGQMAGAITRLVHDDDLRADLVRRGLAQVAGFSWEAAVEAHVAVYRRTLELGR